MQTIPWVSRLQERLVDADHPQVAHDLGPEARIEQVHDGMFDAADILIDRHPVVERPRARPARPENPGRHSAESTRSFRQRYRRCRFPVAPRRRSADRRVWTKRSSRARGLPPFPGEFDIGRQHHRQLFLGYRHGAAIGAVDHRDRRPPVALPGNQPVAQAVVDRAPADAARFEIRGDALFAGFVVQAVETVRS